MSTPTYRADKTISLERLERCARIYKTNIDAAAAMGIAANTFSRLCRQNGIDTPLARRKKAFALQRAERAETVTIVDMAEEDEALLLDVLGRMADQ